MLQRRRFQAFGAAMALEAVLLGGLLSWVAARPATAQLPAVLLDIAPAQVAEKVLPKISLPVQKPKQQPTPVQPKPVALVKPQLPQPEPVKPVTAPPPQAPVVPTAEPAPPVPVAVPAPAPAVTPPAPPPPAQPVAIGPSDEYKASVTAAVQAAFSYPPAAAQMGYHGRVRVAFTLQDAHPSGPRILVSGGMQMIDRAALRTVLVASYPAAPRNLVGTAINFEVWIEFRP
ncbi:MAG: energy transducer TonB [Leptothrix sp. (in: b-proteobacteria)]